MANARNFNRSFSGGELSPEMFGRIDADKYQSGAAKMLNMLVKPQGPAKNRPGFEFVAQTKYTDKPSRLIRFKYSTEDSEVIEIGDGYFRFYSDGLLRDAGSVEEYKTGACSVTSGVQEITCANHGLVSGEFVQFGPGIGLGNISSIAIYGVTVANSNTFRIWTTASNNVLLPNTSGALTFYKRYEKYSTVRYSGYNFYVKEAKSAITIITGGSMFPVVAPPSSDINYHYMPGTVYEVPSPYSYEDIFNLTYTQSNDIVSFAHTNYPVGELRRYGVRDWRFANSDFIPYTSSPTGGVAYPMRGERTIVFTGWDTSNPSADPYYNVYFAYYTPSPPMSAGEKFNIVQSGCTLLDGQLFVADAVNTSSKIIYAKLLRNGQAFNRLPLIRVEAYASSGIIETYDYVSPTPGWVAYPSGLTNGALVRIRPDPGYIEPHGGQVMEVYDVNSATTAFKLKYLDGTPYVPPNLSRDDYYLQYVGYAQTFVESSSTDQSYKITTVLADGAESATASAIQAKNNIYSAGAFNLLSWSSVPGAKKYNVYKEQSGLYGYIGSADALSPSTYSCQVSAGSISGTAPNYITRLPSIFTISTAHDLVDHAPVMFSRTPGGPSLPTNLSDTKVYFVQRITEGVNSGKFYILDAIDGDAIGTTGANPVTLTRLNFFIDDNIAPDMGITPPKYEDETFSVAGEYPAAISYFEQRKCLAGSLNDPQTIWMSKSGTENNFAYSIPVKEDDRVKAEVSSRELNFIRHIVPASGLILLTNSSEWRVESAGGGAITPSSVSVRTQSYIGANNVQPEVVNNNIVYCAARGGHLRELGFSWQSQSFVTGDLSLRAAHLFDNYEIADMTSSKAPIPIVWVVSTSGKLLGMTYIPEEQVASWHQHETDGEFISCASIPEQEEDRLYVVVKRTVNGTSKYYVERLAPIEVSPQIENAFYVDSGVTKIDAVTPFTVFDGLDHLEGKTVSVLADGAPYTKVVSGGQIVLDTPVTIAHAGLPYISDLQTLPVTLQVDGFGQGRNYNVNKAWVRVFQTAGVKVGPSADKLVAANPYVTTPQLQESTIQVLVTPSWQADGQVYIRQTEPLPMTVVGLTFEVSVGG